MLLCLLLKSVEPTVDGLRRLQTKVRRVGRTAGVINIHKIWYHYRSYLQNFHFWLYVLSLSGQSLLDLGRQCAEGREQEQTLHTQGPTARKWLFSIRCRAAADWRASIKSRGCEYVRLSNNARDLTYRTQQSSDCIYCFIRDGFFLQLSMSRSSLCQPRLSHMAILVRMTRGDSMPVEDDIIHRGNAISAFCTAWSDCNDNSWHFKLTA